MYICMDAYMNDIWLIYRTICRIQTTVFYTINIYICLSSVSQIIQPKNLTNIMTLSAQVSKQEKYEVTVIILTFFIDLWEILT